MAIRTWLRSIFGKGGERAAETVALLADDLMRVQSLRIEVDGADRPREASGKDEPGGHRP